MPQHPLLKKAPPADDDEEAPTVSLIEPATEPLYELRKAQPKLSKQDGLFWGGRSGTAVLQFLVRTLLLIW